jgi:hypothetical protein
MTELVTISLDADHLELARREAERIGVSLEVYLSRLVEGGLPPPAPIASSPAQEQLDKPPHDKPHISAIFGIGASAEPTDVGRDKDAMVGEAVWKAHLRKTRQTS